MWKIQENEHTHDKRLGLRSVFLSNIYQVKYNHNFTLAFIKFEKNTNEDVMQLLSFSSRSCIVVQFVRDVLHWCSCRKVPPVHKIRDRSINSGLHWKRELWNTLHFLRATIARQEIFLTFSQVANKLYFHYLDKFGNVGNKGLPRGEQNKLNKKVTSNGDWSSGISCDLLWYWLSYLDNC